jgi:hypothetical protein
VFWKEKCAKSKKENNIVRVWKQARARLGGVVGGEGLRSTSRLVLCQRASNNFNLIFDFVTVQYTVVKTTILKKAAIQNLLKNSVRFGHFQFYAGQMV